MIVPGEGEDKIDRDAQAVFGTKPLEDEGTPVWEVHEYVERHWLELTVEERRKMDALWFMIIQPDNPPPGIRDLPRSFWDKVNPETKPSEYWNLADMLLVDGLTQFERKRTEDLESKTMVKIVEPNQRLVA